MHVHHVTYKFPRFHGEAKDVALDAAKETINNVLDPVKLLTIMALRKGIIKSKTIGALINETLRREDKMVQWTAPSFPVLLCNSSGKRRVQARIQRSSQHTSNPQHRQGLRESNWREMRSRHARHPQRSGARNLQTRQTRCPIAADGAVFEPFEGDHGQWYHG